MILFFSWFGRAFLYQRSWYDRISGPWGGGDKPGMGTVMGPYYGPKVEQYYHASMWMVPGEISNQWVLPNISPKLFPLCFLKQTTGF